MTAIDNGVNVQALLDAREALKGAPEAAQFTWRASSTWNHGVHSTVKVQGFRGLGQEQNHKGESVFEADHPQVFAAEDNGITPIEFLIVGLASCLTAGVASAAQNRGIPPPSSSVRGTRASPRATSCPPGRSTTLCSSAGRWRIPGGASAGTPCGC